MLSRVHILFPLAVFLCADIAPAQEDHLTLVPWKVSSPGNRTDSPLVLYWLPATREELRRSDLLVSRELALFSSRCVAMRVVRSDDTRLRSKLEPATLPAVILTERSGRIVGRVESEKGQLAVGPVEILVRDELERRAGEAEAMLDRARQRIDAGDVRGGVALYRAVREVRCIAPRQGRDAERALRRLRNR